MYDDQMSSKAVFQVIKGVAVALICSVFTAAIFALIMRVCPVNDVVVTVVTQVLKALSLAIGVLLFLRGEKGLIKGIVCGLLFSMLGYLTFSALGGGFSISWLILVELIVFSAVGGLLGVVAVNVKKG
ncbi:MAG: TIGR04086 family membrane protein [Clostridia bacterium]|nr:TIGR04086 family membrane protein [Clostridia bacterium]